MHKALLVFLFLVMVTATLYAQLPSLQLMQYSTGYSSPLEIANCGDSRLFIGEQRGKIYICYSNGMKSALPFLDISKNVNKKADAAGLMGITFHPQYATNGYFYVHYVSKQKHVKVSRFKVSSNNPDRADSLSELVLINITPAAVNHNGGCLRFGADGYLYISIGDGNGSGDSLNNAQNPASFSGKLLRIDVDKGTKYKSPKDNPFFDSAGYKKQIWALGFRNPWRFSFDRLTHDLWLGDDGESSWEEIDLQLASSSGGENYGWRCYEANHEFNTLGCGALSEYTFPLVEYPHNNGDCSVIGGFVYRGTIYPNMYGKYFYNDYCSGKFKMIYDNGAQWQNVNLLDGDDYSFVSFGEDQNGELYTANLANGTIYHVIDASMQRQGSLSGNDYLKLYPNPNHGTFEAQYFSDNDKECTITLIDILGREVMKNKISVQKGWNRIETLTLQPGTFFFQITFPEGWLSEKVVVE